VRLSAQFLLCKNAHLLEKQIALYFLFFFSPFLFTHI